jgi:hypothetical protein
MGRPLARRAAAPALVTTTITRLSGGNIDTSKFRVALAGEVPAIED